MGIIYSTTRKNVYGNDITQERVGQRLRFIRNPDKRVEFVGGLMESSGYKDISDLLRDLIVIEEIDLEESNKED